MRGFWWQVIQVYSCNWKLEHGFLLKNLFACTSQDKTEKWQELDRLDAVG